MSVINTMLRNLDERRAGAALDARLLDEVSATPTIRPGILPKNRRLAVTVAAPIIACAFVIAVLYFWPGANARAVSGAVATSQPLTRPVVVAALAAPPATEHTATAVIDAEPGDRVAGSMLVLATSMAYSGDTRPTVRAALKAAPRQPVERLPAAQPVAPPSAQPSAQPSALPLAKPLPMPALPEPLALAARPVAPASREAPTIRVEQSTQTAQERNQLEVQRAAELQRRGLVADAEASLRGVLDNDKSMVAARLALVALMQRQQRTDEARVLLRDGVALAPAQASLLLPYARLLAARGEWSAASDALTPAAEALAHDAEYRGLCGVVLQRLARFPQSVGEYRAALKLAPNASAWWVGLALSLEGDGRGGEARSAYLQARTTQLTPELAQFVDNKLARLPAE